jgi:transposase InsO family protein
MTHMVAMRCEEHGIEHWLTKVNHPWTTDKIEQLFRDPACYSPRAHG